MCDDTQPECASLVCTAASRERQPGATDGERSRAGLPGGPQDRAAEGERLCRIIAAAVDADAATDAPLRRRAAQPLRRPAARPACLASRRSCSPQRPSLQPRPPIPRPAARAARRARLRASAAVAQSARLVHRRRSSRGAVGPSHLQGGSAWQLLASAAAGAGVPAAGGLLPPSRPAAAAAAAACIAAPGGASDAAFVSPSSAGGSRGSAQGGG